MTDKEIMLAGFTQKILREKGFTEWKIEFGRASNNYGLCKYKKKVIRYSKLLVEANSLERSKLTALHEIAHVIVGPGKGHGPLWKKACIELGGDGIRCYSTKNTVVIKGKWVGTCDICGKEFFRYRKPKGSLTYKHSTCGGKLTFKKEN